MKEFNKQLEVINKNFEDNSNHIIRLADELQNEFAKLSEMLEEAARKRNKDMENFKLGLL